MSRAATTIAAPGQEPAVTDLATARIRRREVLGGLIQEHERTVWPSLASRKDAAQWT
jgi:hypothetical protein